MRTVIALSAPLRSSGFWSSTGSDTTQANEHLTYQLCEPLCLVHKVSVKFYRANYQLGRPVYPAQQVRLSFGFDLSSSGNTESRVRVPGVASSSRVYPHATLLVKLATARATSSN